MENRKKILVVGRHLQTLLVDMLDENGYEARGESTDEQALEAFKKFDFDGVLLGGGVGPQSQEILIPAFTKAKPNIKIVHGHPWQALAALRAAF